MRLSAAQEAELISNQFSLIILHEQLCKEKICGKLLATFANPKWGTGNVMENHMGCRNKQLPGGRPYPRNWFDYSATDTCFKQPTSKVTVVDFQSLHLVQWAGLASKNSSSFTPLLIFYHILFVQNILDLAHEHFIPLLIYDTELWQNRKSAHVLLHPLE